MARGGLSEKGAFAWRLERKEGGSPVAMGEAPSRQRQERVQRPRGGEPPGLESKYSK